MCFGGGTSSPPPAQPLPPPPAAPPPPKAITRAPEPLKIQEQPKVKQQTSKREQSGAVSKGTAQLRIPLNTGTQKSGGLNF